MHLIIYRYFDVDLEWAALTEHRVDHGGHECELDAVSRDDANDQGLFEGRIGKAGNRYRTHDARTWAG